MLSQYFKKIFVIMILSAFATSSFAAWGWNHHRTTCRGGVCHHSSVHKGCVGGHCGTARHGTTWHR